MTTPPNPRTHIQGKRHIADSVISTFWRHSSILFKKTVIVRERNGNSLLFLENIHKHNSFLKIFGIVNGFCKTVKQPRTGVTSKLVTSYPKTITSLHTTSLAV
ncbi:hypothetical protein Gasu2_05160 [Galdieria sulphuraria]|nr:hypothetical protein Gasu2_05160 [Galdieria sulphuraria]